MRIGTHAAIAFGRELRKVRAKLAGLVEQLVGFVTLHPSFEDPNVRWLLHVPHGHLMSPEGSFNLLPIHDFGPGPAFGCAQHNHRPAPPLLKTASTCGFL